VSVLGSVDMEPETFKTDQISIEKRSAVDVAKTTCEYRMLTKFGWIKLAGHVLAAMVAKVFDYFRDRLGWMWSS
jgi:hypothetical protein